MSKPLAPRNWRLNKSREKPPTIALHHGAYPQTQAVDRPTRKEQERRKSRITLPKIKFLDE